MESLSTAAGHEPNSLSSTPSRSHYESPSMATAAAAASLTSTAPSASPSPALSTSTVTTLPSTSISFSDSVPASNPASASALAYQSSSHPPSRDNCERRREGEEETPSKGLIKMPFDLAGKTLSPFLKEHIPGLYAPVGKNLKKEAKTSPSNELVNIKDPNTKYCYRHRPDSKCRRAADETKMGTIQRVSCH